MPPPRRRPVQPRPLVEIEEPEEGAAAPSEPLLDEPDDDEPVTTVRTSTNAWWCPNDDTSMPHKITTCVRCGFIRP